VPFVWFGAQGVGGGIVWAWVSAPGRGFIKGMGWGVAGLGSV